MWHKLKNIVPSLQTYSELSPDLTLRNKVNQSLGDRPSLLLREWIAQFGSPDAIAEPLAQFIYNRFPEYSGIDFSRVQPSDRLEADLYWSLVCWYDWDITLCDDFHQTFGVDLSNSLDDLINCETVGALTVFLQTQLNCSV